MKINSLYHRKSLWGIILQAGRKTENAELHFREVRPQHDSCVVKLTQFPGSLAFLVEPLWKGRDHCFKWPLFLSFLTGAHFARDPSTYRPQWTQCTNIYFVSQMRKMCHCPKKPKGMCNNKVILLLKAEMPVDI